MRSVPFTKNQQRFIIDNYQTLTAQEIADKFHKKQFQVFNFARKIGLLKTGKREKIKVVEGYFNVDAKENWAV